MEESNEKQQLVQRDGEEEEPKVVQMPLSPVVSSKMSSSGNASQASRSQGRNFSGTGNSSSVDGPRVAYVNEKKHGKEPNNRSATSHRSRNIFKDTPDVKHMETALLELLDDFHTGKIRAFGKGCGMEQMMDIREQQERLAKLHFQLGTDPELSNRDDSLNQSSYCIRARDNMTQLVQSLEQLSASIEHLHFNDSTKASTHNCGKTEVQDSEINSKIIE